jgi:hypothetical protein
MKFSSRRLSFLVTASFVGWLVAVAFAATGTTVPAKPWFGPTIVPQTQKIAPGTAVPMSISHPFAQGTGQAQSVSGSQMSEAVFKNVQVLKGIPVDEFMGTMGVFTNSLSLCCGNCHTGAGTSNPDWAADPPRKRTARKMVEMVQGINKANFQGRQVVTCWTCHRGQLSPAVTAPFDFAYGDPIIYPPDILDKDTNGTVLTVDQVFDQYVKAVGGAAATNALTSYVAKGASMLYEEVGSGSPSEIYAKAPNSLAQFVHEKEGDVVRTFDGTTAWFQLPLTVTPIYQLTKTLQEGEKFDAAMAFPWRAKTFFTNWHVTYSQKIDDADMNVLQGSTPGGMIGTLYFDKKTGMLRRMLRLANTAVGRIPTQYDYSDYRPVAGVLMPFKFSYTWVSEREEWELKEYQPNAAIDAAQFGKPAK